MARKTAAAPPVPFDEHIIDIDVTDEMFSLAALIKSG